METTSVKYIDQLFLDISQKYNVAREELKAKHQEEGKNLIFAMSSASALQTENEIEVSRN